MKKLLSLTLAMLLICSIFAGCSNDSSEDDSTTEAPAETADTAEEAEPEDEPDDTQDEDTSTSTGERDFSDAPKVNLTFAMYLAESDASTQDCIRYMDMIKEATDGTVDYTMYAGETLTPADQELDAVKSGLADVAFFPVAYGSGNLQECFMLEYPSVNFVNGKAASYTVNEWFELTQPEELADFKLLFALGQGNGCIMTTFPAETFEDIAGHQIRSGASQADIVSAYGATLTVMVFSEVYEGLRTGVVEGFYGLASAGNAINLFEVTECVVKDPFYIGTYITVMNQDTWDALSDDQRAAITEVTESAFDEFLAEGRDGDAQAAYDNFAANGMTVVEFDQENLDKMIGSSGFLQEEYATELDSKGFNGSENLALYKELAEKYNQQFG